jgi:hypothetical protein
VCAAALSNIVTLVIMLYMNQAATSRVNSVAAATTRLWRRADSIAWAIVALLARIGRLQGGERGARFVQGLEGVLSEAAGVDCVGPERDGGSEVFLGGSRQALVLKDFLDRRRAPQVRDRLADQHQGDRRDDDQELRKDAQP